MKNSRIEAICRSKYHTILLLVQIEPHMERAHFAARLQCAIDYMDFPMWGKPIEMHKVLEIFADYSELVYSVDAGDDLIVIYPARRGSAYDF